MSRDLSAFLNAWPFVQGTISARRIKGRDGLPKVQLRVDLGVLQMEATGRPDGKQPLGHPTWLHALKDRLDTRDQPQRDAPRRACRELGTGTAQRAGQACAGGAEWEVSDGSARPRLVNRHGIGNTPPRADRAPRPDRASQTVASLAFSHPAPLRGMPPGRGQVPAQR